MRAYLNLSPHQCFFSSSVGLNTLTKIVRYIHDTLSVHPVQFYKPRIMVCKVVPSTFQRGVSGRSVNVAIGRRSAYVLGGCNPIVVPFIEPLTCRKLDARQPYQVCFCEPQLVESQTEFREATWRDGVRCIIQLGITSWALIILPQTIFCECVIYPCEPFIPVAFIGR